jgi:hypothetical protein
MTEPDWRTNAREQRRVYDAVTAHWRAVVESAARREEQLRAEVERLRAQRQAALDLCSKAALVATHLIRAALGESVGRDEPQPEEPA